MLMKSNFTDKVAQRLGFYSSTELSPYYDLLTIMHKRQDANTPEDITVFIGDSITQGLATSAVSTLSINYGIGSDTTQGVLKRITAYQSLHKAKAMVLAIGVNDLKRRNDQEIIANFQKILTLIPTDLPVILSAILPVDETVPSMKLKNKRITHLNKLIFELANKFTNVIFLDASQQLQSVDLNLNSHFHIGDGLHLNAQGYDVWIEQLKSKLNNLPQLKKRLN